MSRNSLLILAAKGLSLIGDSLFLIAFPLLILSLGFSSTIGASVVAVEFTFYTIASLFAGAIADKWDARRLSMYLDIILSLMMASLAFYLDHATSKFLVLGFAAVAATLLSIHSVAFDKIPQLSLENDDKTKISLHLQSLNNVFQIIGMASAGVIVSIVGTSGSILINGLSFFASFFLVAAISYKKSQKQNFELIHKPRRTIKTEIDKIIKGTLIIRRYPATYYSVLCAMALNLILVFKDSIWMPTLSNLFKLNSTTIGLLSSGNVIVALIATQFCGSYIFQKHILARLVIIAQFICLFGAIFLYFSNNLTLFIAASIILAVAGSVHGLASSTLRRNEVPEHEFARVYASAKFLSRISAVPTTLIATHFWTFLNTNIIIVALTVIFLILSYIPLVKMRTV